MDASHRYVNFCLLVYIGFRSFRLSKINFLYLIVVVILQMAFVFVFLQEAIFGKGIVQGITEGDPIYIACLASFFASVGGLTIFLAIKGADNYVDNDLGRK
jgi:hypothetical protein